MNWEDTFKGREVRNQGSWLNTTLWVEQIGGLLWA